MARMKKEAKVEIGKLSERDIFMLGIGLYLGEGSKSHEQVRVVNADPIIINLAIKWLRKFGSINVSHIRVAIHGYPDHNVSELINFWSKELSIPKEQFIKTNIDRRQNKSTY